MTAQLKVAITQASLQTEDEMPAIYRALEPSFVEAFNTLGVMQSTLRELVYGIDHLSEMLRVDGCPLNQTVSSPDLDEYKLEMFMLFNQLFKATNNPTWKLTLPSPEIKEWLKWFFKYDYLSTFYFIINQMGLEELEIKVDGEMYSLEFNEIIKGSKINVLHFYKTGTKIGVNIPFSVKRLQHKLKVPRNEQQ